MGGDVMEAFWDIAAYFIAPVILIAIGFYRRCSK